MGMARASPRCSFGWEATVANDGVFVCFWAAISTMLYEKRGHRDASLLFPPCCEEVACDQESSTLERSRLWPSPSA